MFEIIFSPFANSLIIRTLSSSLLISIFLRFLVYQLQLMQERLVFDSENYTNDHLIRHMKTDTNQ